jgi:hypothetical protein
MGQAQRVFKLTLVNARQLLEVPFDPGRLVGCANCSHAANHLAMLAKVGSFPLGQHGRRGASSLPWIAFGNKEVVPFTLQRLGAASPTNDSGAR